MKKIYYLQKYEVKLREAIEYNGIKAIVTEELIELNPELFVVEDSMQELLDRAKRDYPAGTVFRGLFGNICTVKKKPHYSVGNRYSSIRIDGIYVYRDGKWAEILPLKFTTEDGVGIYGDMKTYAVSKGDLGIGNPEIHSGTSICFKYFYHKENALAYIRKLKEKTLEDYENMLLKTDIDSINAREVCWFYRILKEKEPKLFYTKILQLIADDLNDDWEPDFTNYDEKWSISRKGILHYVNLQIHGLVYFKKSELAQKAKDILGDSINHLFN